MRIAPRIKKYPELCKLNLSLFCALSAAAGFMITGSPITAEGIAAVAGVFLLVCGACAMNQYQERDIDALMDRTKERPIPSGRIKPVYVLYFSLIILVAGFAVVGFTRNPIAFLLSVSAVVLYNGVYTFLKKKTAFASVPCAVIGIVPPAVGWFSGGGAFPDPKIAALCFLFYMWQLTHFWLLFLSYGNDYKKAGLPSVTALFSQVQMVRIVFIWIAAMASACMLIPLYGLMTFRISSLLLIPVTIWLLWNGVKLIKGTGDKFNYHFAFKSMNIFILIVMLLLTLDRVI